jgi:hypothetical protein
MKIKSKNGRILKEGSKITVSGEKCQIYMIENGNVGVESLETGSSWEGKPSDFDLIKV